MTCWTRRRRATGKTCRLGLSSAPSPWGSAWLAAGAVVVLLLSGEASALMCYKDMHGVHTSDGDDPVDTNKFEIRNCTHNGTGKIEKPCMTKTEKSGIVLRNCATISKREEMCEEEDEDGATLCYCLTDYCNGASEIITASNYVLISSATAVVSAIILTRLGTN